MRRSVAVDLTSPLTHTTFIHQRPVVKR